MTHAFNIGTVTCLKQNYLLNDWWRYLLYENVITAGFNNTLGDRGTTILRDRINEYDWVFAYANTHGYVGVGLAAGNYRLLNPLDPLPSRSPSIHLHYLDIKWIYYVQALNDAVQPQAIGVSYPVAAWKHINNNEAEKILREFWLKPSTIIRF